MAQGEGKAGGSRFRRWVPVLGSLLIVLPLGWLSREPTQPATVLDTMASRYRLEAMPFPEIPNQPLKKQRAVHPSLKRISAWISAFGAAVALADLDGDGLANDACLNDPRYDHLRITPVPGTGERFPAFFLPAPMEGYKPGTVAVTGCLPADLNEDGAMDLVVYYWGRTPVAYLRRVGADGAALPPAESAFLAQPLVPGTERWFTSTGITSDLDNDGHLDLFFGNYFPEGAELLDAEGKKRQTIQDSNASSYSGGSKHFFLWTSARAGGEGVEPSVSWHHEQPLADTGPVGHGWTLAGGAADLNGDLRPEIYLANDFGPDRLFYNRSTPGKLALTLVEGQRSFTTPKSFVLGHDSFKGMGVEFADVNADGHFEIHVSNIANKYGLMESHFLWQHTGDDSAWEAGHAPYVQKSEDYNVSRGGWGWDARFLDLDNDGTLELAQATGFVQGKINRWPEMQAVATTNERIMSNPEMWPRIKEPDDVSGHQRKVLHALGPDGRYYEIGERVGWTDTIISRGIGVADVDGDGRVDLAFANQWTPSVFYHNQSPPAGDFLGLHVLRCADPAAPPIAAQPGHPARTRCSPAVGAVVRIAEGQGIPGRIAQVDGGSGHAGKRSPELHFGLGKLSQGQTIKISVRWRDRQGQVQSGEVQLPPGWHTVKLKG